MHFSGCDFPLRTISYLAFQYLDKRIVIDAMDTPCINNDVLNWCDVYGKVNFSYDELPKDLGRKVVPIGPSFAVRIWPLCQAGFLAFTNWTKSKLNKKYFRNYIANYYRQFRYRLPEAQYSYATPGKHYVFFLASLWKSAKKTNYYRTNFIKSCKTIEGIEFEGGFTPRTANDVSGFEKYTVARRYGITEYIEKVKRSLIVFNTPAVDECLGWKLGEFLALGKAIISTPLAREMPAELIHEKHIHFVDGTEESICSAIKLLQADYDYRKSLEINVRQYYMEHLRPDHVIDKLLGLAL